MADGAYARLEPPTPPTGNKKPPPAINKVASYLRTSAYFDAIEQLADDEVLSETSLRAWQSEVMIRRASAASAPAPTAMAMAGI